ncbi:NAD(P)/FAD-dependent oxidoreductase [Hoyosella rhizosphaerae]|uniref:FAD/NAD(P)-binding oxidoreductase n=1 Tax=Hoyosella rhizosphaerae TaxID=1755582 RepID=A0A916UBM1_9ACTN|nr:FAD-dependent oxidoreductase [Hoyosella rhizosphaerae]MBN4925963.1 NAD(P)/FAD-dependent oxidoreductase [Hoyosella rhizosphaerae]GGC66605.1 FAD/NAD(P)-binding oxidoreductase [Hoyosella rhizosphaerae]
MTPDHTSPRHVVIVGNGMAGARLAEELRRREIDPARLAVTIIGEEPRAAYNRILLSTVLAGGLTARETKLKPDNWYARNSISVRTGVKAEKVDRDARRVFLNDGSTVDYDELVLATGSRSFVPPMAGACTEAGGLAPGVVTFRTVDDCDAILAATQPGAKVAVLGGGLLGLEAARGVLGRGADVTVVHLASHPMERQLDTDGGAVLARVLEGMGMRLVLGQHATEVLRDGDRVTGLRLKDGSTLDADLVVISAGVRPNLDLATQAGIDIGRGVLVDDTLKTSDEHIWAIGECAEHDGVVYGLVQPAWEHASVVAGLITGTDPTACYHGTSQTTRLKAHGIDLASMGEVNALIHDRDTEVMALADPTRGRYAKVVVRDNKLVGAVLLGNPEVTGTLTQYFDTGMTVPSDRMALLLGRGAAGLNEAASPANMPGSAVVCKCNTVTKTRITAAFRAGARDTKAIASATRATTGCGGCTGAVDGLCEWLKKGDPATKHDRNEASIPLEHQHEEGAA